MDYAETFHIPPHTVGQTPALWFYRWRLLETARAARQLEGGHKKMSEMTLEERQLKIWVMNGDS
jgi:hypothetical protein